MTIRPGTPFTENRRASRLPAGNLLAQQSEATQVQRQPNAAIDCGWGRLLYAPSFDSAKVLAAELQNEVSGKRDVAIYVDAPQLVLAEAPATLFLDPSLIFRRELDSDSQPDAPVAGVSIRRLSTRADIAAMNRLYNMRGMVPVDPQIVWQQRHSGALCYFIAEDERTGDVIGSVLAVDHVEAFGDPDGGTSLWCLAVDPQINLYGVGQSLVNHVIAHFTEGGRRYLDLSVLHDNEHAIGLYRKLGFEQVPGFVIKHKNAINERLFVGTNEYEGLNPYARLIVDEARRRGISVEILDAEAGIFKLRHCGYEIACRESLTELTGGVAITWCQDKVLT